MNSGNGARRESDEEEVEKFSNFEGRKKKKKKNSKDVQEKRISISNLKIRMMKRNFFKIESQISK